MRVRQIKDIAPVFVSRHDTLIIQYEDGRGKPKKLLQETIGEDRTIDRVAIVDLDDGELSVLGMSEALGGIVGKRKE